MLKMNSLNNTKIKSNLVKYNKGNRSKSNQLDSDGLCNYKFDHIYARHVENSVNSGPIKVDEEFQLNHIFQDIKPTSTVKLEKKNKSADLREQNKKLKQLLASHLDILQHQNEQLIKRENSMDKLKKYNNEIKAKLLVLENVCRRNHIANPPPLVRVAMKSSTAPAVSKDRPRTSTTAQINLNSYTELLLPDKTTKTYNNYKSNVNKGTHLPKDGIELKHNVDTEVANYLCKGLASDTLLGSDVSSTGMKMPANKRCISKKENKTENHKEKLYTITSNSGKTIIQRVQKRRRNIGMSTLSRINKSAPPKTDLSNSASLEGDPNATSIVEKPNRIFSKSSDNRQLIGSFNSSLSDRLRLIDTTPTGKDPYQLDEEDLRDQSPIPKLMLHKSYSRTRLNPKNTKRIYDPPETLTQNEQQVKKQHDTVYSNTWRGSYEASKRPPMMQEAKMEFATLEPVDWGIKDPVKPDTKKFQLAFGESSNSSYKPLEFKDLFSPTTIVSTPSPSYNMSGVKQPNEKNKRKGSRIASLVASSILHTDALKKRQNAPKINKKRPTPTARASKGSKGVGKGKQKVSTMQTINKGKALTKPKKSPLPGKITKKPYETVVGDPDVSWYYGLDPEITLNDIDQPNTNSAAEVEVPRWREKVYTSCYSMEGTENLDDSVFIKRHQKLEMEERRQLRWHMRRVREQRHVEKLRRRQRCDAWSGAGASQPPPYTVLPQPWRDLQYIEITDELPVTAFGEPLPDLPPTPFMLPWIRSSRPLNRSKRSKTMQ